jgi:hypothetical protein
VSRVALADVLWDAANEHLSPSAGYSCFAFDRACQEHGLKAGPHSPADRFLLELGCDTGPMNRFSGGIERQGVRYMWLLLAMHVAEDEGIVIERGAA